MAFSLRRSRLGDGYYKLLRDHLVDPVTRWGLTPNQLSGLSMAVALLVPIGFAVHPFLGTLLMVVSALADSLDGVMARHLGVSSLWGGFVDTVVDQVSDSCYLTGIWLLLWHQPHRLTAMAALVTALVLMLLIGFIRAKSEALRIAAISMPMDRAARVLFFLVWGLLTVLLPSGRVAIVWVGITIFIAVCATTIVLRVLHIKRQLEQQGSDISDA